MRSSRAYRNLSVFTAAIALTIVPTLRPVIIAQQVAAKSGAAAPAPSSVPRLIGYSGRLHDAAGQPLSGTVTVTFSIHDQQEFGNLLWVEVQTLVLDQNGRYSTALGSLSADGMSADVFAAGERWLEVQATGSAPEPRVMFISVPYAIKAHDSDTLGGRPASAYLLARTESSQTSAASGGSDATAAAAPSGGGNSGDFSARTLTATVEDAPGLELETRTGAPMVIRSTALIANLNADLFDNLDSAAFPKLNMANTFTGNQTVNGRLSSTVGNGETAIQGISTAAAATGFGVVGRTSAAQGASAGVYGVATAASGAGSVHGVYGETTGLVGAAVRGLARQGLGVEGISEGNTGMAMLAQMPSTTGSGTALMASVNSATATPGVFQNNGGGNLLIGKVSGAERFRIDGNGAVYASSYRDLAGNPIPSGTGDITAVNAGAGLTGGGGSGAVSIAIDTAFTDGRYAGAVHIHDVSQVSGAATLAANSFTGAQTISGNLVASGTVQALAGEFSGGLTSTGGTGKPYAFGLRGETNSSSAEGVLGSNIGVSGVAIRGVASGTAGWGVVGQATDATGTGVRGWASAGSGANTGVLGQSSSTEGTGVQAVANSATGATVALRAQANSPAGVAGIFNANGGDIVVGQTGGDQMFRVDGAGVVYANSYRDLSGNPIGISTNSVGSPQVIDDSLTASDLAANSVTASELATDAVAADKVAFNFAASTNKGGPAVDLACVGCVAASEVGFSFAGLGANTFTATQTIDTGNLDLDMSTATAGTITKNGTRFLHNFAGTFLGFSAGNFTTTGVGDNTGIGTATLVNNTNGNNNTAVGSAALNRNTSGFQNTAAGLQALLNNTTGSNNVALGVSAGFNATNGSNNVYLGANVQGVAGESNAIYLGNQGTQTKTIIAGIRGTTVSGGEMVVIDSNGRLGSAPVASGANSVGSSEVVDDSLTAADLAPDSVTTSELAADSVTAAKVAFGYAASASEGGPAADLACIGCVAASEVGFSFAGLAANTFTATQTIDTGNFDLDQSGATSGNVTKNGQLFLHNFGTNNTFLGVTAGNLAMTGDSNTGLGGSALVNNTTGTSNTATGYFTLRSNTTGTSNVASGNNALRNNTVGTANTATGANALLNNALGGNNTATGVNALFNNTGSNNVALGASAGLNATSGSNNIYLGADVLGAASESNVIYIGNQGVQTKTVIAGIRGTAVSGGETVVVDANGRLGSGPVTPGASSVGSAQVIDDSLTASDLGPDSVTTSELAADSVTAAKVAFNYAASASEGGPAADLACIGCVAANEVGFSFAGLGANTFTATQTIDNGNLDLDASTATAGNITKNGGRFISNPGIRNTFLGFNAGSSSSTGADNTAVGERALQQITSASGNTAIGALALTNNTTGAGNTAVGGNAMFWNVSGGGNTAMGTGALTTNNDGSGNTAIGNGSMSFNASGSSNSAFGFGSLSKNDSGSSNTAVGTSALLNIVGGHYNVAIGAQAGVDSTGSNNIYLGANVTGVANESNTMYLGRVGTQSKAYIAGVRGITTLNADAIPVMIDSAGQLGTLSSSIRFKEDIRDMGDASGRLFQLRPVTFRYAQAFKDGLKPIQYGLVAEEVAQAFPELAVRNADGGVDTVHYERLSVLLLNEVQKQQRELHHQQERIDSLERLLNRLLEQQSNPK